MEKESGFRKSVMLLDFTCAYFCGSHNFAVTVGTTECTNSMFGWAFCDVYNIFNPTVGHHTPSRDSLRNRLGLAESEHTLSLTTSMIARMLYRDTVQQKHSAKVSVSTDLIAHASILGHGRVMDARPISADYFTQLIGKHFQEASSPS